MAMSAQKYSVVTFGCGDDGQLGRGDRPREVYTPIEEVSGANFPQSVELTADIDLVAVSCGSRHTMALTSSGDVYSWGWGMMGQLGHGTLQNASAPTKVQFFADAGIQIGYISCGGCHSAAVTKEGELYMWGESHWSQLGLPKDSINTHHSLPTKCIVGNEDAPERIVKISCGGAHTAALTDEGRVYTWGRCDSGQLGIGRSWVSVSDDKGSMGVSQPRLVDDFDGESVVQVACGAFHTAAVTSSGKVYVWGKEDFGMLGTSHVKDIQRPQRVTFFDDILALRVSCGGWHTVVVARSGACYSFGRGEYGRLGLGDTKSRSTPQLVEALKDKFVVQAACGGSHTLFLTSDGEAYSAGRADHGRLGHEELKTTLVPQLMQEVSPHGLPIRQVSTGGAHSAALLHSSHVLFSPLITPQATDDAVPPIKSSD